MLIDICILICIIAVQCVCVFLCVCLIFVREIFIGIKILNIKLKILFTQLKIKYEFMRMLALWHGRTKGGFYLGGMVKQVMLSPKPAVCWPGYDCRMVRYRSRDNSLPFPTSYYLNRNLIKSAYFECGRMYYYGRSYHISLNDFYRIEIYSSILKIKSELDFSLFFDCDLDLSLFALTLELNDIGLLKWFTIYFQGSSEMQEYFFGNQFV